ncbi:CAP domain-containing protein [Kangiella marina]|uniref:SCP domain-containing protein n=1 Tax=Kangiella marina TaxID=1079178 RepID=A0ABP8IPP5_9GAMM
MLKSGLVLLSSFYLVFCSSHSFAESVLAEQETYSELEEASYNLCGNSERTRLLAQLIVEDSDQLRESLQCNEQLASIAQSKAEEMASQGKVSHYGIEGGPDRRLMASGYRLYLPDDAIEGNHVEAVQGGYSSAYDVLDNFKNSYQHRVHLFGEHAFFLQQDEIGVGYASNWDTPHVDYWVVYIASQKHPDADKNVKPASSEKQSDNK